MTEEANLLQRLPYLKPEERRLIAVAVSVRTCSSDTLTEYALYRALCDDIKRLALLKREAVIDALLYLAQGTFWPQLPDTLRKLEMPLAELTRLSPCGSDVATPSSEDSSRR